MAFAKMFGAGEPRPVPKKSLALFTVRDAATVATSFVFPKPVGKILKDKFPNLTDEEARAAAQLICPVTVQAFTAPIHLLALDLYNRESVVGGISRAALSAVL